MGVETYESLNGQVALVTAANRGPVIGPTRTTTRKRVPSSPRAS